MAGRILRSFVIREYNLKDRLSGCSFILLFYYIDSMNNKIINLGLDIDGTITARPDFFAKLSRNVKNNGGMVYIVTSRHNIPEMRILSIQDVRACGVVFDELYITPNPGDHMPLLPDDDLNWYEEMKWHKVWFSLEKGIDYFFDDNPVVVDLFQRYAPGIKIIRA